MTYSIIDLDTDSVESVHASLDAARLHYQDQSTVVEYRDGRDNVRVTTYHLHHRIRDDATGERVQ